MYEFLEALKPYLKEGVEAEIGKVFHHEFFRLTNSEGVLCFNANCDDEENSWIEWKSYGKFQD